VKVLVVDDSGFARRALIKLIKQQLEGWEIFDTDNGHKALDIFKEENPDIVFLDLTMPVVRGEDVLQEIKSISPDSKVIVVSADIQQKTKDNVMSLGADYMVNKPISPEKFAEALTKIMI
jgi:CheY-like chemotaxis protein